MPSIDLYVNYGVHGVRDCSRPAMAMDGIQYLREVRGRPPPVESVGLLTGGPDRRRPGSIYTPGVGLTLGQLGPPSPADSKSHQSAVHLQRNLAGLTYK